MIGFTNFQYGGLTGKRHSGKIINKLQPLLFNFFILEVLRWKQKET